MGTDAWRNWNASLQNRSGTPTRFEDVLYSDASLTGSPLKMGPYTVFPTLARGLPMPVALVLRGEVHTSLLPDLVDPQTNELLPTDASNYHGGSLSDEVAALLSLALGVRCRAGGTTRLWYDGGDSLGMPMEYDRQHLTRPGPADVELLPRTVREVSLGDDIGKDVLSFPHLERKNAVRLARAARLYANALWWANEDANFAWLQLVGAVEAIAGGRKSADRPPVQVLAESVPDIWAALDDASDAVKEKRGIHLDPQGGR